MSLTDVDWSQIPEPTDDGGADHLPGLKLTSLELAATNGDRVDLSRLKGITVLYIYPMTGRPGQALPEGWDMIPGARGCTPQSCSFRDHHAELLGAGASQVYGLSVQDTEYQCEAAERLHLPFPLLSDKDRLLRKALNLPMIEAAGNMLLQRMSMIIEDGVIATVNYPVFPPDQDAANILSQLKGR